jgi:hypothetical protein
MTDQALPTYIVKCTCYSYQLDNTLTADLKKKWTVLSRAINFARQCHFKIWLDCHKFKKNPCLIMPMSTKCQKIRTKWQLMSYNMMIGYDIYDCFTMEHFRLRQRMTLTIKIDCSRLYIIIETNYDKILERKTNRNNV